MRTEQERFVPARIAKMTAVTPVRSADEDWCETACGGFLDFCDVTGARYRARRLKKLKEEAAVGRVPSPVKQGSLSYSISPVQLSIEPAKEEEYFRRIEGEHLTDDEHALLQKLSATNPGVLVGYQIEAWKPPGTAKGFANPCVILGIQSAWGAPTEFLVGQFVADKRTPGKKKLVQNWIKLNRKAGSKEYYDFRILRRVISVDGAK